MLILAIFIALTQANIYNYVGNSNTFYWTPVGCYGQLNAIGGVQLSNAAVPTGNGPTNVNYPTNYGCANWAYLNGYPFFLTQNTNNASVSCYGLFNLGSIQAGDFSTCITAPGTAFSCVTDIRSCMGDSNQNSAFIGTFMNPPAANSLQARITSFMTTSWGNSWLGLSGWSNGGIFNTASSTSTQTSLAGCQTACNNDVNSVALNWWNNICYCLMAQLINGLVSFTASSGGQIQTRMYWGICLNTTSAAGLLFRNGTLASASYCDNNSIFPLQLIQTNQSTQLLSSIPLPGIGNQNTDFVMVCSGSQSCAWSYSYAASVSWSLGFSVAFQFSEGFIFASAQETYTLSVGVTTQSSETSTISGTINPGQSVTLNQALTKNTYRTTTSYQTIGPIGLVYGGSYGTAQINLLDLSTLIPASQATFYQIVDSVQVVETYLPTTTT